jgi:hypothetical protein
MSSKHSLIAAAVAAAMAAGVSEAQPTIQQAASTTNSLVIAGSSAAEGAIASAIQSDLCGGAANTLSIQSTGNSNFLAFSCFMAKDIGTAPNTLPARALVTFYYRTEGDSIVGALPIITGAKINRLDLSACAAANGPPCVVGGTSANNGIQDSFFGTVAKDIVQLGVTDVEPGQLIDSNYPTAYSTAAYGHATPAQLAALNPPAGSSVLFQQIFGLAVNTSGQTFSHVNLSKASAANILDLSYTDWAAVPDATGNPVATARAPITVVNAEAGSGTRAQASIYFLGIGCVAGAPLFADPAGAAGDYFSTGDDLAHANTVAGAVTYTVVDQIQNPKNGTKYTNLVLATINGIAPSTLNAATGFYDDWFEAVGIPNPAVAASSPAGILSTYVRLTLLPPLGTAPLTGAINAIPNVAGNGAAVPATARTGTATMYINPFTRVGNSCHLPFEANE